MKETLGSCLLHFDLGDYEREQAMNRSNVISGVVCLGFGISAFWLSADLPTFTATDQMGGRFFPRLVSIAFMLASIGLIVTGLMDVEIQGGTVSAKKKGMKVNIEDKAEEQEERLEILGFRVKRSSVKLFGFIAAMTVYTIILPVLGYILASLLSFMAMIVAAGERRPLNVMMGATVITVVIYVLFAVLLGMNVPESSLF